MDNERQIGQMIRNYLDMIWEDSFDCPHCKANTQAMKFSIATPVEKGEDDLYAGSDQYYRCLNCNRVFSQTYTERK